jgi:alpha-L-arabinofuranosidase
VAMANCAQLINCLNSLYLAHENRFVVTPVGHVFAMYAAHQGGDSVRTMFSAPAIYYDRDGKRSSFWGLRGSASLKGKQLVLTAVNPDVKNALEAQVVTHGARVKSVKATVLTAADIHAHNSFDQRRVVVPEMKNVDVKGPAVMFTFPPASVTKLELSLA